MKEYRIVKETTTNTNITKYYIEEKMRFFWWKWWSMVKYYHGGYDITFCETYDTYEEAKCEIDKLTDKIIREVVE